MIQTKPAGDGLSVVRLKLAQTERMRPVSAVLTRALRILDDPRSNAQSLAKVISDDEVVTGKLLGVVNSAFYGLPRKVATVSHAVTLLGYQTVRAVVVGTMALSMGDSRDPMVRDCRETVWQHSMSCAVWSKAIATRLGLRFAEEAFVAGLLHDVGKLVLLTALPKEYVPILQQIGEASGDCDLVGLEQEVLRTDHQAAGDLIASRWGLPPRLKVCIMSHHGAALTVPENVPDAGTVRALVAVVRSGNSASRLYPLDHSQPDGPSVKTQQLEPELLGALAEEAGRLVKTLESSRDAAKSAGVVDVV